MSPVLAVLVWIGFSMHQGSKRLHADFQDFRAEMSEFREKMGEVLHVVDKRVSRLEWAAEKRGNEAWQASVKR